MVTSAASISPSFSPNRPHFHMRLHVAWRTWGIECVAWTSISFSWTQWYHKECTVGKPTQKEKTNLRTSSRNATSKVGVRMKMNGALGPADIHQGP